MPVKIVVATGMARSPYIK